MNTQLAPTPQTLNTVPTALKRFYAPCPGCEGEGQVEVVHHYGIATPVSSMQCETLQTCAECDGEGQVEIPCPECDGEGTVEDDDAIMRPCAHCSPAAIATAPGTDTSANTLRVFCTVGQQVESIEGDDLVWDTFQVDALVNRDRDIDEQLTALVADDFPGYALVEWWVPNATDEF